MYLALDQIPKHPLMLTLASCSSVHNTQHIRIPYKQSVTKRESTAEITNTMTVKCLGAWPSIQYMCRLFLRTKIK